MRPPECARCGEGFDPSDGGATVEFRRTAASELWHERAEQEGFVGHPPNLEWFCNQHLSRALELRELSLAEAMATWERD